MTAGRRDRRVLLIDGEVDLGAVGAVDSAFREASEAAEAVVDLRRTSFIDCAGLAAIVAGCRSAAERGASVRLRSSAAVDYLVELLGGWRAVGWTQVEAGLPPRPGRPV